MKTEDQAWRELQQHAAAQLRPDFADRVLRATQGPDAAAWDQLRAHAAAQLRPGFAERVLRAARALSGMPPLLDQFAFSAATAALCLLGVIYMHARTLHSEDQRNLASWERLVDETRDLDNGQ